MKNKTFWKLKRGDYWMQSQVVFTHRQNTHNLGERKYVVLSNGSVYCSETATNKIVHVEGPISEHLC